MCYYFADLKGRCIMYKCRLAGSFRTENIFLRMRSSSSSTLRERETRWHMHCHADWRATNLPFFPTRSPEWPIWKLKRCRTFLHCNDLSLKCMFYKRPSQMEPYSIFQIYCLLLWLVRSTLVYTQWSICMKKGPYLVK